MRGELFDFGDTKAWEDSDDGVCTGLEDGLECFLVDFASLMPVDRE